MKVRDGVISLEVCGEFLLVATRTAAPFCPMRFSQLNASGRKIWEALAQGESPEQLTLRLQAEYPNAAAAIAADVRAFCAGMVEKGFLCKDGEDDG